MLGELVGARVPEGLGRVIDGQKLGKHACQVWDNGTRVAIARVHLFNARVWIHLGAYLIALGRHDKHSVVAFFGHLHAQHATQGAA